METVVSQEAAPLWPYAVAHLSEVCRGVTDLHDRMLEIEVHPGRCLDGGYLQVGNIQQEIERLTLLLDDEIRYLGRVLDGLRSVTKTAETNQSPWAVK